MRTFGIVRKSVGFRRKNHNHAAAFKLRCAFNAAELSHFRSHTLQLSSADLRMRDFTAAETDGQLHLVAVIQKLLDVAKLGLEIMLVNRRAQTDFFDIHNLLVLAGFLVFLLQFIAELPVIHNAAYRRFGGWSDIDKIKVRVRRELHRFTERLDSQLLSVSADQTNFFGSNFLID